MRIISDANFNCCSLLNLTFCLTNRLTIVCLQNQPAETQFLKYKTSSHGPQAEDVSITNHPLTSLANTAPFRLISGDVRGSFRQFFGKVEKLNKKSGPFDFLLCVGDFFGENNDELIAYKNGNRIGE